MSPRRAVSWCWPVPALLLAGVLAPVPVGAQESNPIDLQMLSNPAAAFPLFWKPYIQAPLPPLNLRNGPLITQGVASGKLQLSLRDFLHLVVENDLDVYSARYNFAIAQIDILRAQSGQAARGTPLSPLPNALFAGAIGAGVNTTAGLSAGGTGGAAITTAGKLVALTPRGNFDPTFSLNLSYDHLESPLNTVVVAGANYVTVPTTVLQTRYQQQFSIGTSFAVSFNLQTQTSTQHGLLFNPALTSFAAFQVYQPLLNGFGLALTRRFVTIAENNRMIVREAFHTSLNNTLQTAANAYWDLTAMRENVRVAEEAVAAAQQQYDEDRERVDLGTMAPLGLLSAESLLASSRVQLIRAQTTVQQQEVLVKTFISKTGDPALDAANIDPTDALPGPDNSEIPSVARSLATALAGRSSIRSAELGLRNQRIAQDYTRKNLLPTFSVFAALDLYGLAPGTSPALRQLAQWAYPEYSVGFTFSLPVFNRQAQADDVRARLEAQQAETTLQQTKGQIEAQVQTATVGLTQGRARIAAAQRALAASREALNSEQEKLQIGTSTPYRVTLAQRDFVVAQSAEIQARVNYAKALIAHQIALGGLLESNEIVLDDALRGSLLKGATVTQ